MQSPTKMQSKNQQAIMHDELASEIHDTLLDENNLDLAHAFNAAVCEIVELYKILNILDKSSSYGFTRGGKKIYK